MLKHLAIFLCYAGGAAALAFYGPQWLPVGSPLAGPQAALGLGAAVLLGGGLLHAVYARLASESFLAAKLLGLRHAPGEALDELDWTLPELATLTEALALSGGATHTDPSH